MVTPRISSSSKLGVAPLCAVHAPVEEYVGAAARAGFDFVGVRLSPVTAEDVVYRPKSREFRHLLSVVRESGLDVLDVEVFGMMPGASRDDWMPVLEMAAELGASLFNVVGKDPDQAAFADAVGRLTEDARPFSILPVIEPIAYLPMDSYERAIGIALDVGCGVELDGLHVLRTGADMALIEQHPELFPVLQLCDAPAQVRRWGAERPAAARPGDDELVIESRLDRLLPGRGAAPLDAMLAAIVPGTPVSVEIPNLQLQALHTTDEYMALLHAEALAFLSR